MASPTFVRPFAFVSLLLAGCPADPQPRPEPSVARVASAAPSASTAASGAASASPPVVHEPGSVPSARPTPAAGSAPVDAGAPTFKRLSGVGKSRTSDIAPSGILFPGKAGLVAIQGKRGVEILDVQQGTGYAITTGAEVGAVLVSPDESLAVISDGSGRTTQWDTRAGTLRATWPGECSALAISPDGSRLAAATMSNDAIVVRDAATGAEVRRIEGSGLFDVVFSQQGKQIVHASNNVTLTAVDLATGREVASHGSGTTATFGLAVSPDGRFGAGASPAGHGMEVFEVRVDGNRQLVTSDNCKEHVWPRFSRNGRLVFAHGGSRWVKTFESGTWKPYASYHATGTRGIVSAADDLSRVLLTTEQNTDPVVITVETNAETKLQGAFAEGVTYALSSDGLYVAGGTAGVVKVWSAKTGALVLEER